MIAGDLAEATDVARGMNAGAISLQDTSLTVNIMQDAEKTAFGLSGMGGSRMGPAALTRFLRTKALVAREGPVLSMDALSEDQPGVIAPEEERTLAKLTYLQAIGEALAEEMRRDPSVFILGEDVASNLYGATSGFVEEFGVERVRDTPISEGAIAGAATGAALAGMRPIADFNIAPFMYVAMDQIVSMTAKSSYIYGGQFKVPAVMRAVMLYGTAHAAQHSDRPYPTFMTIPGLKIIAPTSPYDVKGLLKSAIRDDDPVLCFEDGNCWLNAEEVPDEEYLVPLGVADVKRTGTDVTVVGVADAVNQALVRRRDPCDGRGVGRGHRSAHPGPTRHGDDPGVGGEDPPSRAGRPGARRVQRSQPDRGRGRGRGILGPGVADHARDHPAGPPAVLAAPRGSADSEQRAHRERCALVSRMNDGAGVTDIRMPQWGMAMKEGGVNRWLKAVGDRVEVDEPLVEIESAKTVAEVVSPVAGTLVEILVAEGGVAEVRAVLARISDGAESGPRT